MPHPSEIIEMPKTKLLHSQSPTKADFTLQKVRAPYPLLETPSYSALTVETLRKPINCLLTSDFTIVLHAKTIETMELWGKNIQHHALLCTYPLSVFWPMFCEPAYVRTTSEQLILLHTVS